jgi:hypothetical protein
MIKGKFGVLDVDGQIIFKIDLERIGYDIQLD